ncbi:MAG: hypothetical protein JW969_06300 [Spirochaetales bacterium]|nr:hypothetical protein [Spirochaetales bacterium]
MVQLKNFIKKCFEFSCILSVILLAAGCPQPGDNPVPPVSYTLTVAKSGNGTVEPDGEINIEQDSLQTIKATPDTGWHFSAWEVTEGTGVEITDPAAAETEVKLASGDGTVTALFILNAYSLNLASLPAEGGNATADPDKTLYDHGESVALTAVPAPGYSFDSWTGGASGTDNPLTVTMSSDLDITAQFTQLHYTVTAIAVPSSAAGKVNINPNKTDWVYNDQVTFTAIPAPYYHFVQWSGNVTGTVNPLIATVTGNMIAKAVFEPNIYTLTCMYNHDPGQGTWDSGGNMDPMGSRALPYGQMLRIAADPTKTYYILILGIKVLLPPVPFTGWQYTTGVIFVNGSAPNSNPAYVQITQNAMVKPMY